MGSEMNLIGHHQLASADGFPLAEGPHLFGKSPNWVEIASCPILRNLGENRLKFQVKDIRLKCANLLESSMPIRGITNNRSVVLMQSCTLLLSSLLTAEPVGCFCDTLLILETIWQKQTFVWRLDVTFM